MIVDGTNVLHALSRSSSPVPAASLIGRLRAVVPPEVAIVVMLDGSPEHGMISRRVASGVEVRYAGRVSGDEAIAMLLEREFGRPAEGVLVVTDDIELGSMVRRAGGRTVRNGWLVGRLGRQRLSAPVSGKTVPGSIGRPAPAPFPSTTAAEHEDADPDAEADSPRWSPGRGATRKKGNPKRGH